MKWNWVKFWRWFNIGVAVVASRSGKVRRVMGRVQNYLDLVRELEDFARERGGGPLPFEDIRKEFGLSVVEAQELVRVYHESTRLAVVVTGLPGERERV